MVSLTHGNDCIPINGTSPFKFKKVTVTFIPAFPASTASTVSNVFKIPTVSNVPTVLDKTSTSPMFTTFSSTCSIRVASVKVGKKEILS